MNTVQEIINYLESDPCLMDLDVLNWPRIEPCYHIGGIRLTGFEKIKIISIDNVNNL